MTSSISAPDTDAASIVAALATLALLLGKAFGHPVDVNPASAPAEVSAALANLLQTVSA